MYWEDAVFGKEDVNLHRQQVRKHLRFSSNGEFQIFSSLQIKQERNLLTKADKFCFIRRFTALSNQKP